ncbi:MAG TPA: GNAT family N-acetyltransferase [Chloroflexia bacterium]|nr:GNAT family N-acetyltransferase [Chloroflexia bacterium]
MQEITLKPLEATDREMVRSFTSAHWGAETVVVHGEIYLPYTLPGFAAYKDAGIIGVVTYRIDGSACEIVTLNSLSEGQGTGTALIQAVRARAVQAGCRRLWLITTNDNLNALKFYQKLGFRLVAIHPGAVDESRKLKPAIPLIGEHGIPIRDELELELRLEKA